MSVNDLPHLNAALNGVSAVLLSAGFVAIKSKRAHVHRALMLSALVCSSLFLISYLIYHYNAGRTVFRDPEWLRPYYLVLLLTHTVLAVAILPMVIMTVWRAVRGDFQRHRRLARWTWPVWMYVSVTGVLIYFLLYQWFPQAQSQGPRPARPQERADAPRRAMAQTAIGNRKPKIDNSGGMEGRRLAALRWYERAYFGGGTPPFLP